MPTGEAYRGTTVRSPFNSTTEPLAPPADRHRGTPVRSPHSTDEVLPPGHPHLIDHQTVTSGDAGWPRSSTR